MGKTMSVINDYHYHSNFIIIICYVLLFCLVLSLAIILGVIVVCLLIIVLATLLVILILCVLLKKHKNGMLYMHTIIIYYGETSLSWSPCEVTG